MQFLVCYKLRQLLLVFQKSIWNTDYHYPLYSLLCNLSCFSPAQSCVSQVQQFHLLQLLYTVYIPKASYSFIGIKNSTLNHKL